MKNILNRDSLRRIEMLSIILENQGKYNELDLAEIFEEKSVQTIRRDAGILREMGIAIHSRKGFYEVLNISDALLSKLICSYLALNEFDTIKNFKLIRNKFKEKKRDIRSNQFVINDKTLAVFVKILNAINKKHKLEISYGKGTDGLPYKREITPLSILRTSRSIYLVGIEDFNNSPRIFLFEKINYINFINKKSNLDNYPDLSGFFRNIWGSFTGGKEEKVVLKFSKEIGEYIKDKFYIETQQIEDKTDYFIMTMKVKISNELISWIMGWGREVEIITPKTLRNCVKEKAEEVLNIYK